MKELPDEDDAATPLTPEEMSELIPTHVTLRSELNRLEQEGILAAEQWSFGRKRAILDETFLKTLHKQMFKDVWHWAGAYRKTERNLGVDPLNIKPEIKKLLDDARYWIEHKTYPADEIAIRFHHRLVWIHPFPNGNGRHARLAADLLAVSLDNKRFEWGRRDLASITDIRKRYIAALRAADNHDIHPLLRFSRRG